MEDGNHGSALLEKMLRARDPNVQSPDDINRLCDIILRASRIEHGLLVNFGGQKFQIKKYILSKDA